MPGNFCQYRYYQFYSNMIVVLLWTEGVRLAAFTAGQSLGAADLGIAVSIAVFATGSRNTLRTYYERMEQLLGHARRVVSTVG